MINEMILHNAVEFSSVYYFTDDTKLILIDKSITKINKHIIRLETGC